MNVRRYLPVIIIVLALSVMVAAQGLLNRAEPDSPDQLRSQVGNIGNSLDDISKWDLEIELFDDSEVNIHYEANDESSPKAFVNRDDRPDDPELSGAQAVSEIEMLVGSLPTLSINQPLTLIQSVLDQLEIDQSDISEFELGYRLVDGTVYEVELEIDGDDDE